MKWRLLLSLSALSLLFTVLAIAQTTNTTLNDKTNLSVNQQSCAISQLAPATEQQVAAHPWLRDKQLPETVGAYSEELGQVLRDEQDSLSRHWGPEFRKGSNRLSRDDEKTQYSWELILHNGADEYRVKRTSDGAESMILLTDTKWMVFSGDGFKNLVAEDTIPSASTLNP